VTLAAQRFIIGQSKIYPLGDRVLLIVEAGIGAYVTNGIPFTPADFGLRGIDVVLPVCVGAGYTLALDDANKKIKAFQQPAAAGAGQHTEVPNATDLSAVKAYFIVIGIR
jgi:hypothetical protein